MAAEEQLNAKIDALETNQNETRSIVGAVITGIGSLRAEIQALRDELAANAEDGLTATATAAAMERLDALTTSTQETEDLAASALSPTE